MMCGQYDHMAEIGQTYMFFVFCVIYMKNIQNLNTDTFRKKG